MSPAKTTYTFTLFVHGTDILSDESMDALFEAGCDDATFGSRNDAQYGEFDREAVSFSAAKLDVDPEAADLVAALNATYDLRGHTRRLPKATRALIHEALST